MPVRSPWLTSMVVACVFACSAAASGATLSDSLPLRKDPEVAGGSFWFPALLLLACAGIAGGILVWQRGTGTLASLLRRLPREPRGAPVRAASVALTQQASVHVVQWQGEEFLLGCTAQQVTLLSRRRTPDGGGA